MHFLDAFEQGFKRSTYIRIEHFALFRRNDVPPLLYKQGYAKGIFNKLNLMADCRVRQTQFVCCVANTLVPRCRFKALKCFQRR